MQRLRQTSFTASVINVCDCGMPLLADMTCLRFAPR
jgi:hypothetical protein